LAEFDRLRRVNLEKIIVNKGLGLLAAVKAIFLFLFCSLLGSLGSFCFKIRTLHGDIQFVELIRYHLEEKTKEMIQKVEQIK